jgi:hypothetical protein
MKAPKTPIQNLNGPNIELLHENINISFTSLN